MGRHVVRALLTAGRPEGWELIEKYLLAAQRQEGLRQVVLEAVDEAHPEAFRRMVRLILDHGLARFSSVARAVNVWFGFQWDSVSTGVINRTLEQVLTLLGDADARRAARAGDDPEAAYLALWATAFTDAHAAVGEAAELLTADAVERRFVAAHLLRQLDLPAAKRRLIALTDDPDLRVALVAFEALPDKVELAHASEHGSDDFFERAERLLARMPAKQAKLGAIVWPWTDTTAAPERVAGVLTDLLGGRPATRLIPHLARMSPYTRAEAVPLLARGKATDAAARDTLFALVGDRNDQVREAAVQAVAKFKPKVEEVERLEGLLTRSATGLRRGVVSVLLNQPEPAARASADRLLAGRDANQRLAGLELLRQLVETRGAAATARERAAAYRDARPRLSEDERRYMDELLREERREWTLDDALGLMDPAGLTPPAAPKKRKVAFVTPAAVACLKALDELIHEHREEPITVETYQGEQTELLGNASWHFPAPDRNQPPAEEAARLPLRELWDAWWRDRPKVLRDKDGCELVRAAVWAGVDEYDGRQLADEAKKSAWMRAAAAAIAGGRRPAKLRYETVVHRVLDWLLWLRPPPEAADFLLDAAEATFALVPADRRADAGNPDDYESKGWRESQTFTLWPKAIEEAGGWKAWSPAQQDRLWRLLDWRDRPAPGAPRDRPPFDLLLAACEHGAATEADLLDHLLGPRTKPRWGEPRFDSLRDFTGRKPPAVVASRPELRELADRIRERVLEVELARGEAPTAASGPAGSLGALAGAATLWRVLDALGPKPFARGGYGSDRLAVFHHLLEVTHPLPADTPEAFTAEAKARIKAGKLTEERLLELAFLAPQWLPFVEHTLGWPGLAEGVWWFLAHMRFGHEGVVESGGDEPGRGGAGPDADKPSAWERLICERTPLTAQERREGGVDVAWFHSTYELTGPKRWRQVATAAKYGCTYGMDYKKPALLADVLLGRAKKSDLVAGVKAKRLRESVRLLGLLPLAKGAARDGDLRQRYRVLQEYARYARSLGAMSRASAVQAAATGVANLARTAGYPDPVRFEWAMEAEAVADLAAGPQSVTAGGITVTLSLDAAGPHVDVAKGGKPLKAVPPAMRKLPKVAALLDRKADLARQASRVRRSLEEMMCRGDAFAGDELQRLMAHPVLAPLLGRLVLVGEGIAGYPVKGGMALEDHAGKLEPVKKAEQLRIAHPHDLYDAGHWHRWQHECFARERVQPFKQMFRELYLLTKQERADGAVSRRYAGQQVQPRQAIALLNGRGWSGEDLSRTFHEAGLTASFTVRSGTWTPLEVEGWTLAGVEFRRRGEWKPVPLGEVPPRVFSEVMRDLDLVVSVAHRGGVDPEASASTVEMRAALVRETCALLKINNIRVKEPHILIDGHLGKYSVHLGSAVVHRQPGGALCIVPVHAQHRGRLFLPFADDDPRTAEVVSKVLLLARDKEIQDPSILEQLLKS
jgi:hypothetical protein